MVLWSVPDSHRYLRVASTTQVVYSAHKTSSQEAQAGATRQNTGSPATTSRRGPSEKSSKNTTKQSRELERSSSVLPQRTSTSTGPPPRIPEPRRQTREPPRPSQRGRTLTRWAAPENCSTISSTTSCKKSLIVFIAAGQQAVRNNLILRNARHFSDTTKYDCKIYAYTTTPADLEITGGPLSSGKAYAAAAPHCHIQL